MNVRSAVSSRLALQRFFARTDFVTSKTSISRRSRPGSAAPFKGSRPDRLVFMLSTLSTSQAAKRGAHGNDISFASKCSGDGRPLVQVFSLTSWLLGCRTKRTLSGDFGSTHCGKCISVVDCRIRDTTRRGSRRRLTKVVSSSPALEHVVVHASVRGGTQYKLSGVQFQNVDSERHLAFSAEELCVLIQLRDGDVFSVEKVREGLDSMRRSCGASPGSTVSSYLRFPASDY